MTRLEWGAAGTRYYELGVDRGVLFVDDVAASWSGLVSVSEVPSGGDPRPFYLDGVKYLNVPEREEFEATITAFDSPAEFAVCDGLISMHNGLFATQQPRKTFSLSYRTSVGNDVDGNNHGYKIHIIYNAIASPSKKENVTITGEPEPSLYTWLITTSPPAMTGYKPTSHFVIDSRYTPSVLLKQIEDILYGSDVVDPRLPDVQELTLMFQRWPEPADIDGGSPSAVHISYHDGGTPYSVHDIFIDGGTP